MIEPHREAYEEHEARMLEDDVFEDTANKICKLEKDVDKFRREFDNKGVRDYAMIVSLLMNEVTSAKKFSDKLKAHREKLNELRMARFNEFSEALAFLGTTTQMLYQVSKGYLPATRLTGSIFSVRPIALNEIKRNKLFAYSLSPMAEMLV